MYDISLKKVLKVLAKRLNFTVAPLHVHVVDIAVIDSSINNKHISVEESEQLHLEFWWS